MAKKVSKSATNIKDGEKFFRNFKGRIFPKFSESVRFRIFSRIFSENILLTTLFETQKI
jgi:hypothetical protein